MSLTPVSTCLNDSKVRSIFAGIYKTLECHSHIKETPTLTTITAKLRRLEPISIYENIYVGSQEMNDYYVPKTNMKVYKGVYFNLYTFQQKAIYKMYRMWFVISGNDVFSMHPNNGINLHECTITGDGYTLCLNDIMSKTYPNNVSDVFVTTCARNDIAMARWLCDVIRRMHFPELGPQCLDEAFRHVCERGHVEMAQWLVCTFEHDFQNGFMENVLGMIMGGRCELLRWIIQTYPTVDVWECDKPFLYALNYEQFPIIKYLWHLNPSHPKHGLEFYFKTIIDTGNLQILRWLWERVCAMDKYDGFFTSERITHFIQRAQRYDDFHIIEWLYSIVKT